ncbi:MAG: methyltransferase, partial [Candidatus Aminicenantes bacterium]|nr:methyltransferase [Candidatus Aminicenantes bacterium]
MTRRERVLTALDHREPDRVPVDLGAMRSTGISAVAYGRLKEYLGLAGGSIDIYDVIQQLARPEQTVLDYFDTDVVDLGRVFLEDDADWKPFILPDGQAARVPAYINFIPDGAGGRLALAGDGTAIGAMPADSYYVDQIVFPLQEWDGEDLSVLEGLAELQNHVTWAALPSPPHHLPPTPENLAEIRQRAKILRETTDYAVMVGFGGNLMEWGQFLCRMDQFFIDLAANPRKAAALLDKLVESHLAALDRFLPAVDGVVDIIQMGDDLGTQNALEISPRMYREIFKPRQKILFDFIKKRSNLRVFLHSCGAIADIFPDLIEVGVDIINPVQTSAKGMDPARLKREFGGDITFWGGGCDT